MTRLCTHPDPFADSVTSTSKLSPGLRMHNTRAHCANTFHPIVHAASFLSFVTAWFDSLIHMTKEKLFTIVKMCIYVCACRLWCMHVYIQYLVTPGPSETGLKPHLSDTPLRIIITTQCTIYLRLSNTWFIRHII